MVNARCATWAFVRLTWRDAGIGIIGGLAARVGSVVILSPFAPLLRDEPGRRDPFVDDGLHGSTAALIATVAVVVVFAPLFEELYFRGLVQTVATRRWGAWAAVWIQACCFTAVHYQFGMTASQAFATLWTTGMFGLFVGSMRWYFQRLGPGIVTHAVFNLTAILLYLLLD